MNVLLTRSRYKTNCCGTSAATSCSRTLYRRAIFTGTNVREKPRWVVLRTASTRRHTHGAIFSSRYAIYARWLIATGRSRSENSVMSASWHGNLAEEDESRTEAGRAVVTIKQQSLGHAARTESKDHTLDVTTALPSHGARVTSTVWFLSALQWGRQETLDYDRYVNWRAASTC